MKETPKHLETTGLFETPDKKVISEDDEKKEKKRKDTIERLEEWSQQWLYVFATENRPKDFLQTVVQVEKNLDAIAGMDSDEPVLSYEENRAIFFSEFIKFAKTLIETKEPEQVESFLARARQEVFGGSWILSGLEPVELLFLSAKANRIPEIQDWLSDPISGEAIYALDNSGEESVKNIVNRVNELAVGEALDIVEQLRTFYILSPDEGYDTQNLRKNIREVFARLNKSRSPIVALAVRILIKNLDPDAMQENEGYARFSKSGFAASGRVPGKVTSEQLQEHATLAEKYGKHERLKDGHLFRRIATDAVAVVDHADWPRRVILEKNSADVSGLQKFETLEKILADRELNPLAKEFSEEDLLFLQHIYNPELKKRVEEVLGVDLSEVSFRYQIHFLQYLANIESGKFSEVAQVLSGLPESYKSIVVSLFAVTAKNPKLGGYLLFIAKDGQKYDLEYLKDLKSMMDKAYQQADVLAVEFGKDFPEANILPVDIVRVLITRIEQSLQDYIDGSVSVSTNELPWDLTDRLRRELKDVPLDLQYTRSVFRDIAQLVQVKGSDLSQFKLEQEIVLKKFQKSEKKFLFYEALNSIGRLSIVPEIHWRVDRTSKEYARRLGVDLNGYLVENARQSGESEVLLEIGPGSGVAKKERAEAGLADGFQDYALADKVYYPLAPVLKGLVDFEVLEQSLGVEIDEKTKNEVSEFLYKVAVIAERQTAKDNFDYDPSLTIDLNIDLNYLKSSSRLERLAVKLALADTVPDTISARDEKGGVVYPNKIRLTDLSPLAQTVLEKLKAGLSSYLIKDLKKKNLYEFVEAFPANILLGDISQVGNLKPDQVGVSVALRSTVYKRDAEYVEFMQDMEKVLKPGGVFFDDSIRDNDGWYYRVAELLQAKSSMSRDTEILVVLGPPFKDEDYAQGENAKVPLALVMTKQASSLEEVKRFLNPGCSLVSLESLAYDTEYLKTLDKTGWTAQRVSEAMSVLEQVV